MDNRQPGTLDNNKYILKPFQNRTKRSALLQLSHATIPSDEADSNF